MSTTSKTYIVGNIGRVYRRDNHSGSFIDITPTIPNITETTWRDVMTDPSDPNKVIIVGDDNLFSGSGILVSSNAGSTWTSPTGDWSGNSDLYYELWYVDSDIIWAVARNGVVSKSLNGGVSFNKTTRINSLLDFSTQTIFALNNLIAIVSGGENNGNSISTYVWKTIDGGNNWTILNGGNTLLSTTGHSGESVGIYMSGDEQRIVVSTFNTQQLSIDGGLTFNQKPEIKPRSWLHLTWFPSYSLDALIMRQTGGPYENLLNSNDGGNSWQSIQNSLNVRIWGAHFYTENKGYIISDSDINETFDGGNTFSFLFSSPQDLMAVWTGTLEGCGCPEGYSYSEKTNDCVSSLSVPPECSGIGVVVNTITTESQYGQYGTNFFGSIVGLQLPLVQRPPLAGYLIPDRGGILDSSGFSVPFQHLDSYGPNYSNFWGSCNLSANNYVQPLPSPNNQCSGLGNIGRLNSIGISSGQVPFYEWYGFSTCVFVETQGIYFIGMASDESFRITIDGLLIVEIVPGSIDEWSVWRIFPIELSAGFHVIEMEGMNRIGPGGFGAEIYKVPNDDISLLMSVNSEVELTPYIIWNTLELVGSTFDLGATVGCNCPDGFVINNCSSDLQCTKEDHIPYIPCECYLATNCENNSDQIIVEFLPEQLPIDLLKTYILDIDPNKCWIISIVPDCSNLGLGDVVITSITNEFLDCNECLFPIPCYLATSCDDENNSITLQVDILNSPLDVNLIYQFDIPNEIDRCWTIQESSCVGTEIITSVIQSYEDCYTCLPDGIIYKLIDCNSKVPDIIVSNDLSQYVGNNIVVKIRGNDCCWIVEELTGKSQNQEFVQFQFYSCDECLGVPIYEIIKPKRYVAPGYKYVVCSTDFIDKVKCDFVEVMFKRMKSTLFSINLCDKGDDKSLLENEVLNLKLIQDKIEDIKSNNENCCKTFEFILNLNVSQEGIISAIDCNGDDIFITLDECNLSVELCLDIEFDIEITGDIESIKKNDCRL